eukprot:349284_1
MSATNKSRINEYQHELNKINWKRTFSTNSITFENIDGAAINTTTVQKFILDKYDKKCAEKKASTTKDQTKQIDKNKQKLKNIIKSKHICTVEGYIRVTKQNVSQDIVDLTLFFYAGPIMMNVKYKSQIKCIFYSPMEPEWDTLK